MFATLIGRPRRPDLDHKTVEYIPFSLTGGQRALLLAAVIIAIILWFVAAAYLFSNWVI